jgi:hypothetical protein
LDWEKVEWRMKSRVIRLVKGDENTKYFNNYAKYSKRINTIWKMQKPNEGKMGKFHEIAELGVLLTSNLFTQKQQELI